MTAREGHSESFGVGLRTTMRPKRLIFGFVLIAATWEIAARIVATRVARPDQVMPSFTDIFGEGTRGLAHYYHGGLGAQPTGSGGEGTYLTAALAIAQNTAITLARYGLGLTLAILCGVGLALVIAGSRRARLSLLGLAELLRTLPLLAMAPLFTLWFGATYEACVLFIAFAVGLIMLVGTLNAISNVPTSFLEYARTLGARPWQAYLRIVCPAILPELRGPLIVSATLAWSIALAAELFGIQSGLGWMMGQALRFSLVAQMVTISLIFVLLAIASLRLVNIAVDRVTRWSQ